MHRPMRDALESLQRCVEKYFQHVNSTPMPIRVELSSHLLPGETSVLADSKVLRILMSNSPGPLSPEAMMGISSALVANKVAPDLPGRHGRIPEWVACGFVFRSGEDMKRPFLRLPRHPVGNAMWISGFGVDWKRFLADGSPHAGNSSFRLMGELGWALLSNFSRSKVQTELATDLRTWMLDETDGADSPATRLPADAERIVLKALVNNYFPSPPGACSRDFKLAMSRLRAALADADKDPGGSLAAKNKALGLALEELEHLRNRTPYMSQKDLAGFVSRLSKFRGRADSYGLLDLLEETDADIIFGADSAAYEFLCSSETARTAPGRRYSAILDLLATHHHPHIEELGMR